MVRHLGYTAAKAPAIHPIPSASTRRRWFCRKPREAAPYSIIKVKLGGEEDKELVKTIREIEPTKPLCVDANQGWKDKSYALDMIYWCKENGFIFVEQPIGRYNLDDMAWITERSPLPTVADESCQRLVDVKKLHGVFSAINIKLMKCTGMREAHKMVELARALDMKIMLGCMSGETSCGISAAAQLSPAIDWADLDGNLLISNDNFTGMKIVNGKITLADLPGVGAVPKKSVKYNEETLSYYGSRFGSTFAGSGLPARKLQRSSCVTTWPPANTPRRKNCSIRSSPVQATTFRKRWATSRRRIRFTSSAVISVARRMK